MEDKVLCSIWSTLSDSRATIGLIDSHKLIDGRGSLAEILKECGDHGDAVLYFNSV